MLTKPLLVAMAVATAAMAHADKDMYVTAGTGFVENEIYDDFKLTSGDSINDSWTMELSLGYMVLPALAVEASVTLPSFLQGDMKPEVTQYQLKGLYFFGERALKPYLTAGYGIETFDVPQDSAFDEKTHVLTWGAGLQYDLREDLFGRAELHVDEMSDESNEHGVFMLEVGYRFGNDSGTTVTRVKETTKEAYEPVKQKVAEVKAPVKEKVAPVIAPVVVQKPADSDGDGVPDVKDQCQATITGAKVNAKGCAVFEGKLSGVNFESGSARLTANASTILDNAAAELRKYPDAMIEIAAFTDSQGAEAFNLRLSQQRADSVRNYLIGKGLAAGQLTARGYGEASPVASNETATGRAENRRVELSVK
ncbi:OmpA family protein [Candidatus Thalassolituus haligoni]|uniref:OmpA family protein n=1 Tax=Candidatus Thalassolituus haligoni TaxID=3100113 RepID=UPI00351333C8|tara:strand:- start:7324 stop:8421 length:1098 start_codon:yes stop_codon:yes gene_type:complete